MSTIAYISMALIRDCRGMYLCHHRPLVAHLTSHASLEVTNLKRSHPLTGWRPANDDTAEVYRRKCLEYAYCELDVLQAGIRQRALQIQFDTAGTRRWKSRQDLNKEFNLAKKQVANSSSSMQRANVALLRTATRQAARARNERRLKELSMNN